MKFNYLIILLFVLLVACGGQGSDQGASADGPVVLVEVDGSPVTLDMLERAMDAQGVAETDHERMRALLDELIRMRVVANAARSEGLDEDPEVRAELRLAEMQVLYRRYLDEYAQRSAGVSEQDIRDVYRAQLERSGDTQYRIEVIGYDEQARALKALERLQDGEIDYSGLRSEAEAAGLRIDQPGWIDRSQVPPDFAPLLAETATGEVVPQPLPDTRGWFLVHVEDKRDLQAPAFEQVRDGIARSLQQQRQRAVVDSLYDQAEITPMLPLDEADPDADARQ